MIRYTLAAAGMAALVGFAPSARAVTLTIATVNNGNMIQMQKLSPQFTKETGIKLNWVVLEENVLRQRVTTDIATHGGSFDILTIGAYEAPLWAKRGWIKPVDNLGAAYDYGDLLPPMKASLSYQGKLYAVPFYGESSFLMYRTDLFKKAGLTMPAQPTYAQVASFADKLNNPKAGVYGICLRGKPGWGENMAYLSTLVNTMGGAWFNMKWQPQLDSAAWQKAITFYVDLMKKDGPPDATSNGFNANLTLFEGGKCAMWIDATVAAGFLYDPKSDKYAADVGVARAPVGVTPHGASWLWAWALAIPADIAPAQRAAAQTFVNWATSRAYVDTIAARQGWDLVPSGTRRSTYANPAFQAAAPWARVELDAIDSADPNTPTLPPSPYRGIQYVSIPGFRVIGDQVGAAIRQALQGKLSVDQALAQGQYAAQRELLSGGYPP